MPGKSISEKAPRAYQSVLRRQQAEATRNRVLGAAAELFAVDGYARTTLTGIAAAAGVSTETVQAQGPKAALLIAAIEYAAFGVAGEQDVFKLGPGRTLLAADEPGSALDHLVAIQAEIHGRTAGLYLALTSGANSDAKLRGYLGELLAGVGDGLRRVLAEFGDRGWLRDDVGFDEIVETCVVLCSVETYLRITHHDGRSVDHFRKWLRRMLVQTVFAVPQPN